MVYKTLVLTIVVTQVVPAAMASSDYCHDGRINTTEECDLVLKHMEQTIPKTLISSKHGDIKIDDAQILSFTAFTRTAPSCTAPTSSATTPTTTTLSIPFEVELQQMVVRTKLVYITWLSKFRGLYHTKFNHIRLSGTVKAVLHHHNPGASSLQLDTFQMVSKRRDYEHVSFRGVPDWILDFIESLVKVDNDVVVVKMIKAFMEKALDSYNDERMFARLIRKNSLA